MLVCSQVLLVHCFPLSDIIIPLDFIDLHEGNALAAIKKLTNNLATGPDGYLHVSLTPSTPAVPNCCCSKGPAPYWSNPPFLIFDIQAFCRSVPRARAPECQKLKMVG